MILAATDLSLRSDRALHRAALLARQFGARLTLLHVVDDDRPTEVVAQEILQALTLLEGYANRLAELVNTKPDVVVRQGNPFQVIVETAKEQDASLVVMGTHRKRVLRDMFVGTTIERVLRTGRIPVLMVNAYPSDPYRQVLLATDLSEASGQAAHTARSLGLLDVVEVCVPHAYRSYAGAVLDWADASKEEIAMHVANAAREARTHLSAFLHRERLNDKCNEIILEQGSPFGAISRTVDRRKPDLLVIGTRGRRGVKLMLLGSVADEVLRKVECDVLVVPLNDGS
jgi:nucleotide-binding universal stress UspA family protein